MSHSDMDVLAAQPTNAPPGSPEKIAVMAQRVKAGCSCFHPQDRRIEWECYTPKCDSVSLSDLFASIREHEQRYKDNED